MFYIKECDMSYEKFVTNYRRYTHAARTYDEAFKTADYSTAVWRCETENEKWARDNSWWIVFAFAIIMMTFIIYPTFLWIIK